MDFVKLFSLEFAYLTKRDWQFAVSKTDATTHLLRLPICVRLLEVSIPVLQITNDLNSGERRNKMSQNVVTVYHLPKEKSRIRSSDNQRSKTNNIRQQLG